MSGPKVLIVDDQAAVCAALQMLFEVHGIGTLVAHGPAQALDLVARDDVGCVVQDMNFTHATTSGEEGLALLSQLRALDPELPVVLMTAWTSVEMAVEMMKRGARDYVAKPWNDAKLLATVTSLLRLRELAQDNRRLRASAERARAELATRHDLSGVVYASPRMHEVVSLAVKVAAADVPVLVTGPNGAGKEQIADLVHANSRRRRRPFVKVNAGALPESLLEAELFGAEAGSYTGASKLRVGRFEEADGATLFLDEIGNLSPQGQMKLLRVLQTGEFQRLGSGATRRADVRVISATNADLPRMIREGTFREDLYYRLAVIELAVAPLRARPDDVLPLAEHFLAALSGGASVALTAEARQCLVEHDWPGNARELKNRLQRAVLVRHGSLVTPADLGLAAAAAREEVSAGAPDDDAGLERQAIEQALARANGVVSRAASELGFSRQALYRRMERLGMSLERRVRG